MPRAAAQRRQPGERKKTPRAKEAETGPISTHLRPGLSVLSNGNDLIYVQAFEQLLHAAGPADFEGIDPALLAQSKMLAVRVGCSEAFAALDFAVHGQAAGFYRQLGSHSETIGLHTPQVHFEPVVLVCLEVVIERIVGLVAGVVAAELREDIECSGAVQVDERYAMSLISRPGKSNVSRQVGESAVAVIPEKAVRFQAAHLRVAGAEIEVDIPVVIDIGDSCPHGTHGVVEFGVKGHIGEGAVAVVAVEAVAVL